VQLWGYTFMETALVSSMMHLAEEAHGRKIPIFFDPGPQLRASEPQIKHLLQLTQVILLTEAEVPLVTGGLLGSEGIEALLASGPSLVVLKQGGKGLHGLYSHRHDCGTWLPCAAP
ncbi:MAG: hypothetical protein N3A60_06155, partial [Thermanaerothrix sp.]|nr:hypothetical protein [Thermanaerothrix sp.]